MKKLLKIFAYLIISAILIIVILFVTASLSQKKIVDIALKKLSETIAVPLEIEDLSFTLIKRFPYATVELSGVKIGAMESIHTTPQNQLYDDILKIKTVFISVKTKPLVKGEFEIVKVEISDAKMIYEVDSVGTNNIKSLIENYVNTADTSTTRPAKTNSENLPTLVLKKLILENIDIFYSNKPKEASAKLFIPVLDIEGEIVNKNFSGNAEGNLRLTACSLAGTNLNRMQEATFDYNLHYNADTLDINLLEVNTDGANLTMTGKTVFVNEFFGDLELVSIGLDLNKLVKYAPDNLLKKYNVKNINGMMNLSGSVRGYITDSVMPAVDLSFDLSKGAAQIKDYPTIKKLDFNGSITNGFERNNKTTKAIFKSFHAETDSSSVDLFLSLTNIDQPKYTLDSKLEIDFEEFKDYIPDSLIQNVSGALIAEISTKGQLPDSINDNFINAVANNSNGIFDFSAVNFELDSLLVYNLSAIVKYAPGHLDIDNLNVQVPSKNLDLKNSSIRSEFTGLLTEPEQMGIRVKSFYTESPQGNAWGSAVIENLKHPDFKLESTAFIYLDKIKPYLSDTLVKNLSGNVTAKVSSYGKLNMDSVNDQISDIIFQNSKLSFDANNVSLTLPDTLQNLTGINGEINMANDTISISKMSGSVATIDFNIDSTTIRNVYEAVIKNRTKTVFADGNIEFVDIDYSALVPFFPANKSGNEGERDIKFEVKGKIAAKSFRHEKIFLEDITAKFNISDSTTIIDQFKTRAFDGFAISSLRLSKTNERKQIFIVKNVVDRMDISKVLYAFDSFGQDSIISHENIMGLVSLDFNSRFVVEADTLVTNDMRAMGDLTLENGRIVNYQPAMDIAEFTGLKELDNIELKTVNSSIFLFKNKIYVPATDVVSTSLDFSVFGMQSLGNNYEYHLQMKLGEVLTGKSKRLIERQNKNGDTVSEDDMDRSTIKIIYADIDGKEKTGFDTKKAQQQMQLKIQVQKKMLDLIFHPKLVSFETGVN